jgi:O-Antigen ligase
MLAPVPERLRTGGIVLVPALPVIGLFVYWAAHEGGYLPTTWEPSALIVLGLLVAATIGIGLDRVRLSRPAAIALGALAAYTAWSYLSIAWAASPGDALDGSNRTLLFLLTFALFALLPWREWTALATLSAFALGIGAIAVVTLVRLGDAGAVPSLFSGGRLVSPLGYVNATAAIFLAETVLAIALAARRELPVLLRGLLLACASAALAVSVLAESRGWLFALPVVIAVTFALVPGRLRLALWSLPVAALGAVALRPLLDVFERSDAAGLRSPEAARQTLIDAAAHAGSVALPLVAVAFAAGAALALLDRRVTVPAGVSRGAGRALAAVTAVALLGAVAAGFAASDGRPDRKIADYWDRSQGYQETAAGSSRFGSVGSNRPDFWQVSLEAFADHPIGGLGQDNWGDFYLRKRDSNEQPRWTHSLEMRLLAHTGAVGFLLFATFLVAVVAAALRGRRSRAPAAAEDGPPETRTAPSALARALAAIALLPLVVWLVHGSIDWFWEVPALSGPAFAFAGLASAMTRKTAPAAMTARTAGRWRPLLTVAAGGGALVAALVLALPYLAERDTAAAAQTWHERPADALSRLNRAADLNPLSARPDLTAGVIALELGDPQLSRLRFDRALQRDPDDWFAHFGRGLAETALGQMGAARADYRVAQALTPREPLIAEALRRVGGRRPMTAEEAFSLLRRDVQDLTGTS